MSESKTAVVAGASGLTGSHILDALLTSPHYDQVVALVRKPLGRSHPKLRELPATLEGPSDLRIDDVFCALGTTIRKAGSKEEFVRVDKEIPLQIVNWALQRGARQFALVSSVSSDPKSATFYLQVKGELESGLNSMNFQSVHVARPSFLLGHRKERRLGERIGIAAAALAQPLLIGGLRIYRSIESQTVAKALVNASVLGKPGRFVYHFDDLVGLAGKIS